MDVDVTGDLGEWISLARRLIAASPQGVEPELVRFRNYVEAREIIAHADALAVTRGNEWGLRNKQPRN